MPRENRFTLFGQETPEAVQKRLMGEGREQDMALGQLSPTGMLTANASQAGRGLGQSLGSLMGGENIEVLRARAVQETMKAVKVNPEEKASAYWKKLAGAFQDNGMSQEALQSLGKGQELEMQEATIAARNAEIKIKADAELRKKKKHTQRIERIKTTHVLKLERDRKNAKDKWEMQTRDIDTKLETATGKNKTTLLKQKRAISAKQKADDVAFARKKELMETKLDRADESQLARFDHEAAMIDKKQRGRVSLAKLTNSIKSVKTEGIPGTAAERAFVVEDAIGEDLASDLEESATNYLGTSLLTASNSIAKKAGHNAKVFMNKIIQRAMREGAITDTGDFSIRGFTPGGTTKALNKRLLDEIITDELNKETKSEVQSIDDILKQY